jgi:hypothetical protein
VDPLLDFAGIWLPRAFLVYGFALLFMTMFGVNVALTAAAAWAVLERARGRVPWPSLPPALGRRMRLAVEVVFGLANPILYLAVLAPSLPALQAAGDPWRALLTATASVLLTAFWGMRIIGPALRPRSPAVAASIQALLFAMAGCLAVYIVKDARWAAANMPGGPPLLQRVSFALGVASLYLLPALLLWDYIRQTMPSSRMIECRHGLFVVSGRTARVVVALVAVAGVVAGISAAQRRSETSVRHLVREHRGLIAGAAARYGVDARLVAAIVYVAHRDQVSPFRDSLERLAMAAWAANLRADAGLGPPDHVERVGSDENPLLNRILDVSVGLAQIKPRTAQTASVLAGGRLPDELPGPEGFTYRDAEPLGDVWNLPTADRLRTGSPIPVPAPRRHVAGALLDARTNLEACALILALYQHQWETANPAWTLRGRPDILATLYQIGFARSHPHASPGASAFGRRVADVSAQPWLAALLDAPVQPAR